MTSSGTTLPRVGQYVSRWDFILDRCRDKRVLHLGCIGITEGTVHEKIAAMKEGRVIHARLREVCGELHGIDHDQAAVQELNEHGFSEIVCGNVERIESLNIPQSFDVILCGDLIEHLSQPGRMLENVRRLMDRETEVLITTPNAFGGLHFLRYTVNRFSEGNDHVLSFSFFTLGNLLKRYGLHIEEVCTCYNRPASTLRDKLRYALGIPFFKVFPKFGGTLLVIAKCD